MLHLYRQSELRRRYPSSTWVLEDDDGLRVELKNPLSRDWWATWAFNPQFAGMRWYGLREGLRLVRVSRFRPVEDQPPPEHSPPAPHEAVDGLAGPPA